MRLSSWRSAPRKGGCTRWKAVAPGAVIAVLASAGAALAAAPARLTYIATAASAGASPQVVLAQANGTSARPLGPATTAVLSSDGAYVAAVAPGRGSPSHGSSLVVYTAGSKKAARTLRASAAQLTILAWAPDDAWIAVTDGNSLVAVPLHGKARTLTSGTSVRGASFAPRTPDRLVFGQTSLTVGQPVNLYSVNMNSSRTRQLTRDGLSEYPLWGPSGIVFSHAESSSGTTMQLWQLGSNGHAAAIATPPMSGVLEPVALSANGQHLLANLVGVNTSQAWCIDLSMYPVSERPLGVSGTVTIGNAISLDGTEVLLTEGTGTLAGDDFSKSTVAVVPWNGGAAITVAQHGAFASWDR